MRQADRWAAGGDLGGSGVRGSEDVAGQWAAGEDPEASRPQRDVGLQLASGVGDTVWMSDKGCSVKSRGLNVTCWV